MKNIKLKLVLAAMIIVAATVFYSCEKEKDNTEKGKTEQLIPQKGLPLWATKIIKFVNKIEIKINFQNGNYHEEIDYYPNGTIKKHRKWCDNEWKICNWGGSINTSTGDNLSSFECDMETSCHLEGCIGLDENKNLILAVNVSQNKEFANLFFYSDIIDFTCPYIIDNSSILKSLALSEKIQIFGKYFVYKINDDNGDTIKYIILNTKKE